MDLVHHVDRATHLRGTSAFLESVRTLPRRVMPTTAAESDAVNRAVLASIRRANAPDAPLPPARPRRIHPFSFQDTSKPLPELSRCTLNAPGMVVITVCDSGVGVSYDTVLDLFSLTPRTQRLTGGHGLGLYTLRKRMEALGGDYGYYSRLDGHKGSAFWFAFPYRPDPVMAAGFDMNWEEPIRATRTYSIEREPEPEHEWDRQRAALEASSPLARSLPPMRILLVDDEQVISSPPI